MSDNVSRLSKYDIGVQFEYDNDDNFSLSRSRDVFDVPLWRTKWAYNFVAAEEEIEKSLKREDYTESLVCTLCCGDECDKCTYDWICCGNVTERPVTPGAPDKKTMRWEESENIVTRGFNRIVLLNPFFNIHYTLHVVVNIPIFYSSLLFTQLNAVLFRMARWTWHTFFSVFRHCKCCYIDWHGFLSGLLSLFVSPFFLTFTGVGGVIIYWSEIVINSMIFRPLIVCGIFLNVVQRNRPMVEPLVLNTEFRDWIENMFRDWAWAADSLKNDPDGIEGHGRLRDPIFSAKQTLSVLSLLPNLETQKNGSEIAAPFGIQVVVLWIVFKYLVLDNPEMEEEEYIVRELAALGAFLYYMFKATDSLGKFALLCRGHTNNLFLLIDFLGNVVFPYIIIPLAVQIVLISSGLDIVLNLIAIDFVTNIDEELFDESAKQRYKGPYCFVFSVRPVPKRFLGIWKQKTSEHVLVVDVYRQADITERVKEGGRGVLPIDKVTKYWIKDTDLSQFQAKVRLGDRLNRILELKNISKWNTQVSNTNGESKEEKRNTKRVKIDIRAIHLRVTQIPVGVEIKDIRKAVDDLFEGAFGHYLGSSFLERATHSEENSCCDFKEIKGNASLFYSKPSSIPGVIARFQSENKSLLVNYSYKGNPHQARLEIFYIIPELEIQATKDIAELREVWAKVIGSNYQSAHQEHALRAHVKTLGEKTDEGRDSRVMIVYNFPFVDEGSGEGCKNWLKTKVWSR